MSAREIAIIIIVVAILSPILCGGLFFLWKARLEIKKILRRNELLEAINKDVEVRKAIIDLVVRKEREIR